MPMSCAVARLREADAAARTPAPAGSSVRRGPGPYRACPRRTGRWPAAAPPAGRGGGDLVAVGAFVDRTQQRDRAQDETTGVASETPFAGVAMRCAAELRAGGMVAALRYLNARTRFRFTGVYRADPPVLRNLYLFDRENPALNVCGDVVPLTGTYCAIAYGDNEPFTTDDAQRDERLRAHPARESVLSYCGVPLRDDRGRAWGTLCHYDVRPRLLSLPERHVLEDVAPLLVRWLAEKAVLPPP